MNKKYYPYLIMIIPPLLWAGNFIVGRAVSNHGVPLHLSFWRWSISAVILLPFVINPIWKQRDIIKSHLWGILILAFFSITAFNSLAYIAVQYTTATNATLLNSFIPIFIIIISAVFFKEKTSKKQILGIVVSLIGVLVILTKLDQEILIGLRINKGDLWMLLAALDWAFYSLLLKYLRPKELGALPFLGIMIFFGILILAPILYWNPFDEQAIEWTSDMIKAVSYIAIFPSIIAYLSWNYGIQKLGASIGGQYIHLMPLFGALMAVVFLGEKIQLYHLVGGAFIALGLWLSILQKVNK